MREWRRYFSRMDLPVPIAFDHAAILRDYFRFKKTGQRPKPLILCGFVLKAEFQRTASRMRLQPFSISASEVA